jgi:hypothetical protein
LVKTSMKMMWPMAMAAPRNWMRNCQPGFQVVAVIEQPADDDHQTTQDHPAQPQGVIGVVGRQQPVDQRHAGQPGDKDRQTAQFGNTAFVVAAAARLGDDARTV